MTSARPNFFLIGAAKSGTTALCSYLRRHPGVFMSDPKEPHYFAEDFGDYRAVRSLAEYRALFEDAAPGQTAVGEASNTYMMSKVAAEKLHAFNPDARIMAILRNPVEMVHAAHAQYLHLREETVQGFDTAWGLRFQRENGDALPASNRDARVLCYHHIARYAEQLERWLAVFPREQIKLMLFDDLVNDTRALFDEVQRFLGLDPIELDEYPVVNRNRRHKSALIGHVTTRPPAVAVKMAQGLKSALGIERLGLLRRIRRLNDRVAPRAPMSAETLAEVRSTYADDVRRLAEMTGWPLETQWGFERPS